MALVSSPRAFECRASKPSCAQTWMLAGGVGEAFLVAAVVRRPNSAGAMARSCSVTLNPEDNLKEFERRLERYAAR